MMDVDFELDETDRINEFLNNKLSEIKSINNQLEDSLKQRTETKLKCRQINSAEKNKAISEANLEIASLWTKISNNKYVLAYKISTGSDRCCIQRANAILNWDAASQLNYGLHHASAAPAQLNCHVYVITFNLPEFLDRLSCTVSGLLTLTLSSNHKISLRLPEARLRPEDAADANKLVQMYRIIEGNFEDFTSCKLASERCEFDLVYPANGLRLLDTLLELDCSLAKVNVPSSSGKFFLVHKISPLFDGNLLQIESEEGDHCALNIFYTNEASLLALVHYLHRHLINALILPRGSYQKPELDLDQRIEMFKNSVFEEIDLAGEMLSGRATQTDLVECKRKLADLETKSDVLAGRVKSQQQIVQSSIDFY